MDRFDLIWILCTILVENPVAITFFNFLHMNEIWWTKELKQTKKILSNMFFVLGLFFLLFFWGGGVLWPVSAGGTCNGYIYCTYQIIRCLCKSSSTGPTNISTTTDIHPVWCNILWLTRIYREKKSYPKHLIHVHVCPCIPSWVLRITE